MNMQKLFISHLAGKDELLCASIKVNMGDSLEEGLWVKNIKSYYLPLGYTDWELEVYIYSLNFECDDWEVDGTIWFKDGSWSIFTEDDSSIWWEHFRVPGIPQELELLEFPAVDIGGQDRNPGGDGK